MPPTWQVQLSRFTVFVGPDVIPPATLWREVVGEDAENVAAQKSSATRTESGPFADGTLTLQIQPTRIDWIHTPVEQDGGPSVLGPFPATLDSILGLATRWLGLGIPACQRMALGCVLIADTPSRAAGYDELRQLVEGVPTAPEASDFLYQLNLPRATTTGVAGLRINRLSKWSVAAFHSVLVGSGRTAQIGQPLFRTRAELDINTAPDFDGLLPAPKLSEILADLKAGLLEVSRGTR